VLQFGARLREADPRALSSALWAMVQLDYFPGEDTVRGLEREFAARLAEPGGRPVWRRPVVIFVNALTHYRRSVGRRPSEGLLERIEAWILGNVAAAGGIDALAQQARPAPAGPQHPGARGAGCIRARCREPHTACSLPVSGVPKMCVPSGCKRGGRGQADLCRPWQ